jgi:hypothetical protein
VHRAGIPIGMQNLAFAQPPATSLNPQRMKPDDVKAEKKLIGQKDRTQKNESCIFLRSIFLPIQVEASLCATHVFLISLHEGACYVKKTGVLRCPRAGSC